MPQWVFLPENYSVMLRMILTRDKYVLGLDKRQKTSSFLHTRECDRRTAV